MGSLDIGISGLRVAQSSLLVTEHNIANANNTGYTRQSTVQSTTIPMSTGSGFFGTGVQLDTVKRLYNSFLSGQVDKSQTKLSELDAYKSSIQVIDNLLADPSSGISPALQDFFKGVQQVASYPSQLEARQALVSSAQALVGRFQAAEGRFADQYQQINQQIADNVQLINNQAKQIADLNDRIVKAQSAFGQSPNDLLDLRDRLVSEMNKVIKVSTTVQNDGTMQVFVGTGQQVVAGVQSNALVAMPSLKDPSRFAVGLDIGGGGQELAENVIIGGQLGGLLAFRRETLDSALNSLGNVAMSLALTFNAQHRTGMDLMGGQGIDFFSLPELKVIAPDGAPTIAASYVTDLKLSDPVSSGNYFSNLTGSDYELRYDGAQYKLTRLSDGKAWEGSIAAINNLIGDPMGAPPATDPQGFKLTAPGSTPPAGATYLLQPTREAARNIGISSAVAGDVRRIAAALPVKAEAGLQNPSSATLSVTRMTTSTFSVALPVTMTYAGGALSGLTGTVEQTLPNGTKSTISAVPSFTPLPGATYEWQGVVFSFKGTPANGDTFRLVSNSASGSTGVSDASNIVLLGKLQTQKTMAGDGNKGGTTTLQGGYAQMVASIGNKAREIEVTRDAQKSIYDQALADREAYSGVNLDEEAANLIKFQQAYQAAAKTIEIARSTFAELISILNG